MKHTLGGVIGRLRDAVLLCDFAKQSDGDLVQRFAHTSDAAAFEAIVRRHGPMVLGVCQRVLRHGADADDAFQATFAVLVRKAGSLSRPERLAGWLFQVANRTARRARGDRIRRQAREAPLPDLPVEAPTAEIVWRELQPIFDEEVARLPEKLRLPVILCFLEGQSKRAAAQSLGWAEGTFSCRLQQARELLRNRLARRGIALSAGAIDLALLEGAAAAAVPTSLISNTIQTASLAATTSALSAPVAALTQGVIHSMFLTKLKIVAGLILAVGVLGGGTSWIMRGAAASGEVALAGEPGPASSPKKETPAQPATPEAPGNVKSAVWLPKEDFVVHQLKHIPAQDAQEVLKIALRRQFEQASIRFIVDERTNQILISAPGDALARARKILDEIDSKDAKWNLDFLVVADDPKLKSYSTQAGMAETVAAKLSEIFKPSQTLRIWAVGQNQIMVYAGHENQDKIAQYLAAKSTADTRVEEADVQKAKAELRIAESKYNVKVAELARFKKLKMANVVAQEEVDNASAEAVQAEAGVQLARANLLRAEALLDRARASHNAPPLLRHAPVETSKQTLEMLENRLSQLQKLHAKGFITEEEVDRARIAVAEARIAAELRAIGELHKKNPSLLQKPDSKK